MEQRSHQTGQQQIRAPPHVPFCKSPVIEEPASRSYVMAPAEDVLAQQVSVGVLRTGGNLARRRLSISLSLSLSPSPSLSLSLSLSLSVSPPLANYVLIYPSTYLSISRSLSLSLSVCLSHVLTRVLDPACDVSRNHLHKKCSSKQN